MLFNGEDPEWISDEFTQGSLIKKTSLSTPDYSTELVHRLFSTRLQLAALADVVTTLMPPPVPTPALSDLCSQG